MIDKTLVSGRVDRDHYVVLDGVRGIAVLLVVTAHVVLRFPGPRFYVGLLGVDVFFVLSGFLITTILVKEFDSSGAINLKNFYARRFLRLMPAYWTLLAIVYIFAFQILPSAEAGLVRSPNTLLSCLFYYSNLSRISGPTLPDALAHTWSLAIEEQFYFMWAPLLYLMIGLMKRRYLIILITVMINVLLVVALEYRIRQGASKAFLYNSLECRLFAIMIGSLFAMLIAWRALPPGLLSSRAVGWLAAASFCSALALGLIFREPVIATYRILPPFALSIAFIIVWLITRPGSVIHTLLAFPPLVWVGKTSYGLYLWHPVAIVATSQFGWPMWKQFPVALAASLLVTTISYRLIELPCLRLKQKFSRTQPKTELPIEISPVMLGA